MVTQEKLRELVEGLVAKSRANQVNWWLDGVNKNSPFVVDLPNSKIIVETVSPTTEPDFIRVRFANKDGKTAAEWIAEEDGVDWPLAKSLYSEANRVWMRGDEILQDVETAIHSSEVIGADPF